MAALLSALLLTLQAQNQAQPAKGYAKASESLIKNVLAAVNCTNRGLHGTVRQNAQNPKACTLSHRQFV